MGNRNSSRRHYASDNRQVGIFNPRNFPEIPIPKPWTPTVAGFGAAATFTVGALGFLATVLSGGLLAPLAAASIAAVTAASAAFGATSVAAVYDEVQHRRAIKARNEAAKHAVDSYKAVELRKLESKKAIEKEKQSLVKDAENKRLEFEGAARKSIRCNTCNGYFETSQLLIAHLNQRHIGTLKCSAPMCNATLENQEAYDWHMLHVHDQRVQKCPLGCDIYFREKAALLKHINTSHQ